MFNWTSFTDDPLDLATKKTMRSFLSQRCTIHKGSLVGLFVEFARNRSVLHIGCCEHTESYIQSTDWKHRILARSASRIVGIDINETVLSAVQKEGFEAHCVDATSDVDIGERFEVVIIGDVIEHVDNPVKLLKFAERHLSQGGRIFVSTPNPFFLPHIYNALVKGPLVANFEHVSWITESNMLELARRSSLDLVAVRYPLGRSSANAILRFFKKTTFKIFRTALYTTIVYELQKETS